MISLNSDVKFLKGVGEKRSSLLSKLDIHTVEDLLLFFPRAYEDWNNVYSISSAPSDIDVCIKAVAGTSPVANYIRSGMTIYKFKVSDGYKLMDISVFNNKYITNTIEIGKEYYFFGKVTRKGNSYQMSSPDIIPVDNLRNGIRPVYSQTAGLNSRQIEKLVFSAFENCEDIIDSIPQSIIDRFELIPYRDALWNIHFPESDDLLEKAKRRLSFDNIFKLQIGLTRLKNKNTKSTAIILDNDYTGEFVSKLKYSLTSAQLRTINECTKDMMSGRPMNRLVQGDVGSGKTVVSAALIYNCIKNGYQAALLAPTEVLAVQHYNNFMEFFENTGIKTALLTGSVTAANKRKIKQSLAAGDIDLIIGTHALIQKDVVFSKLGVTVTDEQHRFGVKQRGELISKGSNPHTLVMSATPIPRTLSLIVYGDLDISIIDEMPKGRQVIDTYAVNSDYRERVFSYVKKHLCEGRQGYIVCPLIDENEETELESSVSLFDDLSEGYFKGFSVGLLHGKMNPSEKQKVMDRFSAGEIQLLVATTVIEVGVDVPNAVIMVVLNAERYGLSQLHQLRGRIGRGKFKSTCILISDDDSDTAKERLGIIVNNTDGFKIADEDLRLRGPGDFLGSRQHGLPSFKIPGLFSDSEIIKKASQAAKDLLKSDPELKGSEYINLKNDVNRMFSSGITLN